MNTALSDIDLSGHYTPEVGYADAAKVYAQRGFEPLPVQGKTHVPRGATGHHGTVTADKLAQWRTTRRQDNTALRLPDDVIAIDVDQYDAKTGADNLRELEARLGALPPTYTSTARGAVTESRQHFYRVPEGLHFVAKPCADVEVIQRSHRYSVVAPSVHPSTGDEYLWYGPDRLPLASLVPDGPHVFSELPETWVEYLTTDTPTYYGGDPVTDAELKAVVATLDHGEPGSKVRDQLADLDASSHDDATSALWRLAWWIVNAPHTPGLGTLVEHVYSVRINNADATTPGDRREGDLNRSFAGALGKQRAQAETHKTPDALIQWARALNVPPAPAAAPVSDDFWTARPYLAHVRDTAYRRYFEPMALLGALMQRALMDLPWNVYYESRMGHHAINSMTAFVGTTGGGKSLTQRTLDDAFDMADDELRAPLRMGASGEGIMDAYVLREKVDVDASGGQWGGYTEEWQTHNRAILWGYDEVGRLEGQNKRQGSTLLETFKEAWSGSTLTRSLAGKRATEVPANQYRFCMFVNVQPAKADVLLSDSAVDGGLTGRFLWLPVQNPTADADDPGGRVTKYAVPRVSWAGIPRVYALPEMEEAHKAAAIAAAKGVRAPEDSHALLVRAFTAIALMVLDGRAQLNSEDWRLAGEVMEVSRATRALVRAELAKATAKLNRDTAIASGVRQTISAQVVEKNGVDELVEWCRGKPREKWNKANMPKRLHPYKAEALERLDAEG